jgi:hypothetical protein
MIPFICRLRLDKGPPFAVRIPNLKEMHLLGVPEANDCLPALLRIQAMV